MSPIPTAVAAVLLQSVVYALYVVVFAANGYLRYQHHSTHPTTMCYKPVGWPIAVVCLTLFALTTAHWVVNIQATFYALGAHSLSAIESQLPIILLNGPHSHLKLVVYVAQTLLGDGFFIYRLYIVWGKRLLVVIFPMITTLSLTVSGLLAVLSLSSTLPISVQPRVMILAMYGLTVLTNIFITGMIILRVWRIHRAIQLLGGHGLLQPVILTLLESAGIYTIFVIIAAISGLLNLSAFEPFLSVLGPVMGLSYCLAVLAVTIQRSNDAHDHYDSHQPVTFKTSHIDSTCFTNSDSANIEFASDRGGSACEKGVQAQVV